MYATAPPHVPAASPPTPPELPVLDTSLWGPPLWIVLHTAGQCIKLKSRQGLWANFMNALRTGIPCPDCSAHYNAWIKSHPLRVSMLPNVMIDFSRWILDLHNDVNRRTGKPAWTIQEVASTYSNDISVAREAAKTLQGMLDDRSYYAMMALLNSIS